MIAEISKSKGENIVYSKELQKSLNAVEVKRDANILYEPKRMTAEENRTK